MELIVFLVVWLGLGFWGSRVMSNKGRSAGAGWALGLIGGIFGIVVAYVLDEKQQAE